MGVCYDLLYIDADQLLMFYVSYVRFGSLDILFERCCIHVLSYDVVGQWQTCLRCLLAFRAHEVCDPLYCTSLFCKSSPGTYRRIQSPYGQAVTSRWFALQSLQVCLGCRVVVMNQLY